MVKTPKKSLKVITSIKGIVCFVILLSMLLTVCSCSQQNVKSDIDYSDSNMWAFQEDDSTKTADVFLVAPTVYYGDETSFNMPIDDEENRERIVGALNMQTGLFNEIANVYAPYYRQASLSSVMSGSFDEALVTAYADVCNAFEYYINNKEKNQAFFLSGFSQGAELCVHLMQDYPEYLEDMIACYIYGYDLTESTVSAYPQIRPASGEDDTGVVICFNSEAVDVNDTFTVPNGKKSICINPLNWKTDTTPADKTLNQGACFPDYDASIKSEIDEFTGAYIDAERGTLKLPDVNPQEYESKLEFLKYGEYHLYEYQFFYRNLQENIIVRFQKWNETHSNQFMVGIIVTRGRYGICQMKKSL